MRYAASPFRRKTSRWSLPWLLLAVLLAAAPVLAAPPTAYRGAKILTAADKTFDPGVLVVQDDKIIAVGSVEDVEIPADAAVIDVAGKVIIPGLVDSHSHIGVNTRPLVPGNSDIGESSAPVQSIVRALDALNPFDPGIKMATAGGVTTANIMPGSGNVIGGQTIYVKLRGNSPQQMWIASRNVLGGLKMANGENPKRSYGSRGQAPGTRMKIAALQRAEYLAAQDYLRKWREYRTKLAAGEKVSPPAVDLKLEPLAEVLDKKRTVHFHSHRADDILTLLRLKEEFDFELVIQHGTEAYKVLDAIAKAGVPVSMTIPDSPGGKAEVVDLIEQTGALLAAHGIKPHVNTDDPITESRFMLRTAAISVRGGLPEDVALKAITLYPAEALHLEHRVGSLAAGKDADFVVLSGEPFSVYTRVLETFIDGQKVFDLADADQRLYQVGGFPLEDRSQVPQQAELVTPLEPAEMPAMPEGAKRLMRAATGEGEEAPRDIVILAGRLHTVSRGTIADGAVHVRDGKIVFAGKRDELDMPEGAAVLTASDVTPGLIDAHSMVPLTGQFNIPADQDQDEKSDPNQADVRVLDGFNPAEPLLRFLLTQGVTVIHTCPGRANVVAGMSGVFRTHGQDAAAMAIRFPQAMVFNLGDSAKESYPGRMPDSRMGTAAMIRTLLTEAAAFARQQAEAEQGEDGKPSTPLARNLKQEALAQVVSGKVQAVFCAQRADDIQTALRLSEEYKLKGVVALAADGYLIRDQLAASKLPVIVHPTMQRIGDFETFRSFLGNAAALREAGVNIAIGSGWEGYVPKTRVVRHEAAIGMVYGLGFQNALKAVTLDAATILGIDDRFGSLDAGKAADLVLYNGDPFEHKTHVTGVLVDGKLVYDRENEPKRDLTADVFYMNSPDAACCLGW